MRKVASLGRWKGELRHTHRGGTPIFVETTSTALHDEKGNVVGHVTANRDITARKQAEATIAAQMERLREQAELLDLTHDAIFVRGLDGTIRFWNRGAAAMYGWSAAEAVGQVSHLLLQTEFPQPLEQILAEVIERGRWDGELIHRRRDGVPACVASRWALQRDGDGRPLAILEINNDISRQKAAEAQRAAAQQAIQQQAQRLAILHEIDDAILAARAPAQIAQAALGRALTLAQAERVTVILCDFAGGTGEILAAAGAGSQVFTAGARVPLPRYPMIELVRTGQAATVEDFRDLP